MNKKNLNCHPELSAKTCQSGALTRERHPRSQPPEATPNQVAPGDPEGSQPLHISSRDIAEDTRLNFELDKWFWMPYRKGFALRGMTVLFLLACFPSVSQAEQCTPTPDCKSLGYTETSCPDGGVKCPWNTSLMYCPQCKQKDICLSCKVGMILNSDGSCSAEKVSSKTPIGVVAQQTITSVGAAVKCVGMAVALKDLSGKMIWSVGKSQCNSYSASGVTGWRLPTEEELLTIHGNISSVQDGLTKAGGTQFTSGYYWSSSVDDSYHSEYCVVNPVSGNNGTNTYANNSNYVRPVLAF